MKFQTTVELARKTATGIEVPADVVASFGKGKRVPVHVTINGYTYRSTIASMGGRFMLPLSAENRAGAGVEAGDAVEVALALDDAPRDITLPADFAALLEADPQATTAFEAMSYSNKRAMVLSIEDAKTPETRQRRIEKALATLRGA